ncbi:hypothetical protein LMG19089_03801 [Ralstonia edaphis]|uniref:hypothetical protein n=1 Tax=Ralstonia edaphi TaxID=3058599 RepID=UPI0028F541A8|nr:hypothetical protein [Ralstonia sp. LMG 6871]CAJ0705284.1 hypothetical protein LMG19089_03801 [Ralstonia sp. LMG 6871]
MYVLSKHIQQWLQAGTARTLPTEVAAQLGDHLNRLPWLPGGGGLDWSQLAGNRLDLSALTDEKLDHWLCSTVMGGHSHLIFFYADNQACIACEIEFGMANIDQAFWGAPGKRYVFGATLEAGRILPAASHFAEYDGAGTLVASSCARV